MVPDSRFGGGQSRRQVVATRKVNVGDRSADGPAHKLHGRDSFHEVKDGRDTKKEYAGYNGFSDVRKQPMGYRGMVDARKHVDHNVPLLRSNYPSQQVARGGYIQNSVSGVIKEFRVVKDNRVNQNADGEVREARTQLSTSGNEQLSRGPDEIAPSDQTARNLNGSLHSGLLKKPNEEATNTKAVDSSVSRRMMHEDTLTAVSASKERSPESNSMAHPSASSSNSIVGVYSSFSDPVHVPSPISRSAGKVGTIRREIGVVGGRSQSSYHSSVSDSSFSISFSGKDISLETQSSGQPADTSKGNLLDQTTAEVPILHNAASNKSIQVIHRNSKLYQSSGSHHNATQPNLEWKPKSVQKPTSVPVSGNDSAATSHTYASCNSKDISEQHEKISKVSTARNLHVIIPQHLQVPDLEQLQLSFGSFGFESNPTDELSSAIEQAGNIEPLADGPSISTSASGIDTMASNMDSFVADHGDILDDQPRPFHSGSSASAKGYEELGPSISDTVTSENIEQYEDIGFVQSNSPLYHSSKECQAQNDTSLSSFSEYANQSNYDAPFFGTTSVDNTLTDGTLSEVLRPYVMPSSPSPTMVFTQQGQPVQQQQSVAQLYPQVHIPQYPNFVPFRQFFSPVYVPPVALSNYSGNPAYPHPSTGNNYHLMPGGSSHINTGSLKYPNPQYKPLASGSPSAYGRYTNSNGTFGTMTGLEDMTRHKFKDDNLYVPNPQVEASDMWVQTPQELTGLQTSYYNLPGQAPNVGFMPAHAAQQAAFSTAVQPSHQQYPGLYHTQQSPSVTSPHHLMHHNVAPNLGGGGIGAAPGPQVGAYQHPQLGHYNWTTNF